MKGYRNYIVVLVLALAAAVAAELSAPKQIDWSPSFSERHTIPYGAYVLFQILPGIFPGAEVTTVDQPLYNTLEVPDSFEGVNYIFINESFDPDELDFGALRQFVAAGNNVFIAAASFGRMFQDSMSIKTDSRLSLFGDSVTVNLVAPGVKSPDGFVMRQPYGSIYFDSLAPGVSTVLGIDDGGNANFVRIDVGAGRFYLSTVPMAFTNFNLLRGNTLDYVSASLSYLPVQTTFWDEFYKEGRLAVRSPLRYVLSQESLRWAWYLTLCGIVLFVVVYGRRRQRIIPEITPPRNTTLDFAETIGQLYYQKGDHRTIALKKIAYFFDHVRTHFNLKTAKLDDELLHRLSERSGAELENVRRLFGKIGVVEQRQEISESELSELNSELETFFTNTRR